MFYYVSGTVAHVEPYLAVIDCGGVGYACKTTSTTISQLQVGKASKLYTYLHVGEGIFDLYGFATQGELGSFKQLIGVSGVGPKAALAILSVCTPQGLAMAVITGDEKALIAAPGIGKKIAQRIILELKDKLTKEQQEIGMPTAPGIVAGEKSKAVEAAAALAVLGYTQQDIAVAMKGVNVENLPLEEIVRQMTEFAPCTAQIKFDRDLPRHARGKSHFAQSECRMSRFQRLIEAQSGAISPSRRKSAGLLTKRK